MILAWLLGCCWPGGAAEPRVGGPLPPMPFLVRPLHVEAELGPPFDHGSPTGDHALMHNGHLVSGKRGHRAHDFAVPTGTEVFAAADAQVAFAGDQGPARCEGYKSARNVWIKLDHGNQADGQRYTTLYYHLSEVLVAVGDHVTAGQQIGRSGSTGCSASPHLHFAVIRVTDPVRLRGAPIDPYGWTGDAPDPLGVQGKPSRWLWKDGEAPPLFRRHGPKQTEGVALGPVRITTLDGLDAIGGEWVEIGLRGNAAAPQDLRGYTLMNRAGDRLALPEHTLRPGEILRVWTRRADPGPDAISWDLDHEAWNDDGDCAILVDPSGTVSALLGAGWEGCRALAGTRPRG
jgi:murein DD-endopeptidase MepM/ murein hydrolase activator NlpD